MPSPQETPWVAEVRNIGCGGVGLALPRGFPRGTALALRLCRPDRDFACLITARVLYVVENEDGRFFTNCAFLRPLSADERRDLLQHGPAVV